MNGTNEPIDAQFIFASPTDKSDRWALVRMLKTTSSMLYLPGLKLT